MALPSVFAAITGSDVIVLYMHIVELAAPMEVITDRKLLPKNELCLILERENI